MSSGPAPEPRGRRAGQWSFALLLVGISALLLSLIGDQTRWVEKTALVAQPRFWPFVGLSAMTGFALLHAWHLPRFRRRFAAEKAELARWVLPFEHAGWFMVFVWVVPVVGFLPASLAFATALTWRLDIAEGVTSSRPRFSPLPW